MQQAGIHYLPDVLTCLNDYTDALTLLLSPTSHPVDSLDALEN